MGVKDLILNNQYKQALDDIKYSFLIKLFLRFLLANDSDERPDFITAKKIFDRMFLAHPDVVAELNETLESTTDLDNCGFDAILDLMSLHHSESKQKSVNDWNRNTMLDYDTPNASGSGKQRSKSFKNLWNSNVKYQIDNDYPDTISPLRLDEKFSNWIDLDEEVAFKSKVAEFLEKTTESNPRILPMSKIVNQQNPFSNKAIMWKIHNKIATQACMLLHFGEYFWNSWNHEWGEVQDLYQNNKVMQRAFKEVNANHKDLISRTEALNNRRIETEDVDLIFYHVFDSIKVIHSNIQSKNAFKENDLDFMNNFVQKIQRCWNELKVLKNELDSMCRK